MYHFERAIDASTGTSDTWTGSIGLMYASDFGYGTSSASDICNTVAMVNWYSDKSECRDENWLYNSLYSQWTITANRSNSLTNNVFVVSTFAHVAGNSVTNTNAVYPVLYLKNDVKIIGTQNGSGIPGSAESPYLLGM